MLQNVTYFINKLYNKSTANGRNGDSLCASRRCAKRLGSMLYSSIAGQHNVTVWSCFVRRVQLQSFFLYRVLD